MNWYYAVGGEQKGPVPEAELESLVRSGAVGPDTLIWVEGMPEWRRALEVRPEWAPPPPVRSDVSAQPPSLVVPSGSAICGKCGRVVPAEDTVRIGAATVCAACKAGALQAVVEGVPASARGAELERVYAVAKAQKGVIWCILASVLNLAFMFAVGASSVRFSGGGAAPFMFLPMIVALVILVFQVIYAYRLGAALDRQLAWLWVLGLFVGFFLCSFLGLILLLVLSVRATSLIRQAGFRVGIMGADLAEIRRAMGTL